MDIMSMLPMLIGGMSGNKNGNIGGMENIMKMMSGMPQSGGLDMFKNMNGGQNAPNQNGAPDMSSIMNMVNMMNMPNNNKQTTTQNTKNKPKRTPDFSSLQGIMPTDVMDIIMNMKK